jgi:MFS family permease
LASEGAVKPGKYPSYVSILKDTPFGKIWAGLVVSFSGDYVFDVALTWLVWSSTKSPLYIGLIQACVLAPNAFAGPLFGRFVDVSSKKGVMIVAAIMEAALVGSLALQISVYPLSGGEQIAVIAGVVFTLGVFARIYSLAYFSSLPLFLKGGALMRANALSNMAEQANSLVTYSAAGVIVLLLGITVSISYDALTFVFVAFMIFLVQSTVLEASQESVRSRPTLEGFRVVAKNGVVMQLVMIWTLLGFLGQFFGVIVVVRLLSTIFSPVIIGAFLASLALGGISGALFIGHFGSRFKPQSTVSIGIVMMGLSTLVIAFTQNVPFILASAALFGIAMTSVNVPIETLLQTHIPVGSIATVMGAAGLFMSTATPVGALAGGFALSFVSSKWLLLIASMAFVITGLAISRSKMLRAAALENG